MLQRYAALLIFFWPAAAGAQTYWNYNGSVLELRAKGAVREFVYFKSRITQRIEPGTILFSGRKNGQTYEGTAYALSQSCGGMAYRVSGPVSADLRMVTLLGDKPKRDTACRVSGYEAEVLGFIYIEPAMLSQVLEDAGKYADVVPGSRAGAIVCVQPVFTEELRMQDSLDGTPGKIAQVADSVNYLRQRYCRQIGDKAELEETDKTRIKEGCWQHKGYHRGELVYWGDCKGD